ncbi:MAG: TetR/AcrR family transcriptional regulator [Oryzihumus sp.]
MPETPSRASGRPRSPEKEAAILREALRLLSTEGYAGMTLQLVADAAGVSKSTIHLRWQTKADLVTAALEAMRMVHADAGSGDTRADLVAILEDFATTVEQVNGMALIGTCLAEEVRAPELLRLLRERTVLPRRELLREVLERAVAAGELRTGADLEAAVSALLGAYYADHLAGRAAPGWAASGVDLLLAGLRPAGADTARG